MKVSIVICTRNRAALLPTAIKSALKQSYANYDIIVVDNGSTDETKSVVERFCVENEKVRYVYEPNPGLHNAMKKAYFEISDADWVTVLHDDDEFLDEHFIEKSIALYNQNNNNTVVAIFSNLSSYVGVGDISYSFYNDLTQGEYDGYTLFFNSRIGTDAGALIKRNVLQGLELFDSNISSIDIEIMYKLLLCGNFLYLDTYSYKHNVHESNFSKMDISNISNSIKSGLGFEIIADFAVRHGKLTAEVATTWKINRSVDWLSNMTDKIIFDFQAFIVTTFEEFANGQEIYIFGSGMGTDIMLAYIKNKRSDIVVIGILDDVKNKTMNDIPYMPYEQIRKDIPVVLALRSYLNAHKVSMKLTEYTSHENIYCILDYDARQ